MKIGIWLGYDIKENAGGAFSYIDRLIQLIDKHVFPEGVDVCFVNLIGREGFQKDVYSLIEIPSFAFRYLKRHPKLYRIIRGSCKRYFRQFGAKNRLKKLGLQVIYYLHQGDCLDSNFPFIATNWDIGHRSTYAFPELISKGGAFETREKFYRTVLPKALMVFCESRAGIEEVAKYTNIGEHKLRIFPMFGGSVTQQNITEEDSRKVLTKYGLKKGEYFFYPAQFWAHKNHRNLILSFSKVHDMFPDLKLVLSGSDKGNRPYIEHIITESGLNNKVIFLGFVPIEELYCMYKYAAALVMASHFGPTNMPPIEAMTIGCPVACSDLEGHREILGDAACYFDSYDRDSMTKAMIDIFEHQEEYRMKILERYSETNYTEEKSMKILDNLLKEVVEIRNNWE